MPVMASYVRLPLLSMGRMPERRFDLRPYGGFKQYQRGVQMELADRWAIRYYEWSCERAVEECGFGFPLLSSVLGGTAWKLLEYWGGLNAPEKEKLPRAIVKRFNARALSLIGDTIDAREIKLIDGYLNYNKVLDPNGAVRSVRPHASEKQRVFNEQIDSGIAKRGSRRLIRKSVTKRLGDAVGAPSVNPSGTVKYEIRTSGWRLRTLIDYGGSYGQITYGHVLIPDELNPLFPPISLFGWMGLSGQTTWDAFAAGQEEEVAVSIVRVLSWFAERWIPLVDGLL